MFSQAHWRKNWQDFSVFEVFSFGMLCKTNPQQPGDSAFSAHQTIQLSRPAKIAQKHQHDAVPGWYYGTLGRSTRGTMWWLGQIVLVPGAWWPPTVSAGVTHHRPGPRAKAILGVRDFGTPTKKKTCKKRAWSWKPRVVDNFPWLDMVKHVLIFLICFGKNWTNMEKWSKYPEFLQLSQPLLGHFSPGPLSVWSFQVALALGRRSFGHRLGLRRSGRLWIQQDGSRDA